MTKTSRMHTADEFGRMGTPLNGVDPPMIGAATTIIIDSLVEQESGRTSSPWSLSVWQIVISLVVMLVVGFGLLAAALWANPRALQTQDHGVTTGYTRGY